MFAGNIRLDSHLPINFPSISNSKHINNANTLTFTFTPMTREPYKAVVPNPYLGRWVFWLGHEQGELNSAFKEKGRI